MKIKIQQFLFGKSHSWSIVGQEIGRHLLRDGNEVHFVSTDGVKSQYLPADLAPHLKSEPDDVYDMQLSYTAMHNFPNYLANGTKNRFGIWNYEFTVIPKGWSRYAVNYTDKFLPSSEFSKKIFMENGIPESKMVVIPHGINLKDFENKSKYKLKTKKSKKILLVLGQNHLRKNLPGLLRAYGKAFTNQDDVCLVAKISINKTGQQFEVDPIPLLERFRKEFPKHGEVELITGYVPNMVELYNACDIVFTMSHTECWYLPGHEAMAAGKLSIMPRYGGQLDYANDQNSLLIDGKMIRADKKMQYWEASSYSGVFDPSVDDAAAKLRLAVNKYDELLEKFTPGMTKAIEEFTWDKIAKKIVGLCNG